MHSKTHKLVTELTISMVAGIATLQLPKWFVKDVVNSNINWIEIPSTRERLF